MVQPSFVGSDAGRYILELTSDPPRSSVDRPARLRAAFVEVSTRLPMPASVALADGMPDAIELSLFGFGAASAQLNRVGHGVYEGEARLWAPGAWRAWASLRRANRPAENYLIGSLQVGTQ